MYKVVILPLVKEDIKGASLWYNSAQVGLGKRFTLEVRQKINGLRKNAQISALRYDEVRTAVLDVFPYMIHYSVDEAKRIIVISAVLHTSRNPDIWKERGDQML